VGLSLLNLNGTRIPDFVKVNSIDYSILPPLENNILKVRGRKGLYLYSQELGSRTITASISIIADDTTNPMELTAQLAEWLYQAREMDLVIDDMPNKTYKVVVDGSTDISETVKVGKGTITFLCLEPFAYGAEHELLFSPADDEPFYFNIEGNTETYPQIELTLKQSVTNIAVISDESFVMLGEPEEADKTPASKFPLRLGDNMSSTTLWTSASSVDGGVIQGEFTSDGYRFKQSSEGYGSGSAWHGASAIRSLPSPIQDFEVQVWLGLIPDKKEQLGRIDIYLLDENNQHIGKLEFADKHKAGNWFTFEARAGNLASGTYFINELRKSTEWANFDGMLKIGRKGNKWYAWIGKYFPDKKYYRSRFYKEWTDTKRLWMQPLAKIQIHIGAYGNYPPVKTMYISDLKVFEHVVLSSSQAPIIAEANDVLLIDCEKAIVMKNGEPFYEGLNPASNFFSFKKGLNGLAITPAVADVKITYKERWL
jgi:predicted phage tail component-like protein